METSAPWWMPNDLSPWAAVYQQTQRWLAAGHRAKPTAAIIDSRTLRSTPESGERAPAMMGQAQEGLQDPHGR
ncbi:hypothetical protein GGR49_002879 [Sphingomonas carotinifaciens]|nr:hypothetical protein [Sphingomonas carotinifaciens]